MKNLKLAARETEQRTIINVSNVAFGRDFVMIAVCGSLFLHRFLRFKCEQGADLLMKFRKII